MNRKLKTVPVVPVPQTLLQGKPWVPSNQTDVQATWRKFGWVPKQERRA